MPPDPDLDTMREAASHGNRRGFRGRGPWTGVAWDIETGNEVGDCGHRHKVSTDEARNCPGLDRFDTIEVVTVRSDALSALLSALDEERRTLEARNREVGELREALTAWGRRACEKIPEKVAFSEAEWRAMECGECPSCKLNALTSPPSTTGAEVRKGKTMKQEFTDEHWTDEAGNPAGGVSWGTGFAVSWQNGPLGRGADRREPNGAFVETLIAVAASRIDFYQRAAGGRFNCVENATAILHLMAALEVLDSRTKSREDRGVEGTHAE